MYRVLIVDDEPLVRRGIKNSVNWNEFDIEMVAEAENGLEALEQVFENPPDIILLDVCMSKMNGLEFADIIKRRYPAIRIVIITGFDNFEYIQKALRTGIDDYILKPITREMVENLIKNQISKIEGEAAFGAPKKESADKETAFLLNGFLRGKVSSDAAKKAFSKYADIEGCDIYIAIMRPRISEKMFSEDVLNGALAEFAVSNVAMEVLARDRRGFVFETNRDETALLLAFPQDSAPDEALNDIYFTILDLLSIPVEFGVSAKGSFEEIGKMAEQARKALEASYMSGDAAILHYGSKTIKPHLPKYPKEVERALLNSLLEDDSSRGASLIAEFFDSVKNCCADSDTCKSMIFRLLINIADQLEAMNMAPSTFDEKNELYFDPVVVSRDFHTIGEAREWVEDLFSRTAEKTRAQNMRAGKLYMQITNYIEQNYMDCDLNLKKCSQSLFLSPGYISMILKKNTNKTFVDYLNEFRINRACEILKRRDSKIYEVAQEVGFSHKTYFSSVFKKLTGLTPRQYKEEIAQ